MLVMPYVNVGVAVPPPPLAPAVLADENEVLVGAGVANTVNVCPSRAGFPVPEMTYNEPMAGTAAVAVAVNVKVITSPTVVYEVTVNVPVALAVVAWKLGGAPGPTCDTGWNVNAPVS
jgi:hypothetical protein